MQAQIVLPILVSAASATITLGHVLDKSSFDAVLAKNEILHRSRLQRYFFARLFLTSWAGYRSAENNYLLCSAALLAPLRLSRYPSAFYRYRPDENAISLVVPSRGEVDLFQIRYRALKRSPLRLLIVFNRICVNDLGRQLWHVTDANVSVSELTERTSYKTQRRTIIRVVGDKLFLKRRIV
jgi:hypothetical protein